MSAVNFTVLKAEWPDLHEAAVKVEALAHSAARAAWFDARRVLELLVYWHYKYNAKFTLPPLHLYLQDELAKAHFDTRQYNNHTSCDIPANLRDKLKSRIQATITP